MNNKVAYATLLFIGCKKKKKLILWLCVKRKKEWEEKERE